MNRFTRMSLLLALTISTSTFGLCPKWNSRQTAELDTSVINEASGLGKSALKSNMLLWINDSGSSEAVHATDLQGRVQRTVALSGFTNRDTEALAVAPCPDSSTESCIHVADIGDNKQRRVDYKVGVFRESEFWTRQNLAPLEVIQFKYPSASYNAESFVVLRDGTMLIFTKTKTGPSQIFRLENSGRIAKLGELPVNTMTSSSGDKALITDAALSPDGSRVLILTYGELLEVKVDALFAGRPLVKGSDYTLIPGPKLNQQETVTYLSERSFLVSTEVESGGVAEIVTYSCASNP